MSDFQYTPAPWRWMDGWRDVDRDKVEFDSGELCVAGLKYLDLRLVGGVESEIIPIRIDHYEVEWDGDKISKEDRNLIAAAPELYEALKDAQALETLYFQKQHQRTLMDNALDDAACLGHERGLKTIEGQIAEVWRKIDAALAKTEGRA